MKTITVYEIFRYESNIELNQYVYEYLKDKAVLYYCKKNKLSELETEKTMANKDEIFKVEYKVNDFDSDSYKVFCRITLL